MTLNRDNVATPFTDEWWLTRLLKRFDEKPKRPRRSVADGRRYEYTRSDWFSLLWAYHLGEQPLNVSDEWADSTHDFLRRARPGYAGLVSTALLDRVDFHGVRVVGDEPDTDGDDQARRLLDYSAANIRDALEFATVMGEGYLLVGRGGPAGSILTAEDPRQMVVDVDPVTGVVRAALKLYHDDLLDEHVAALYVLDDENTGDAHQTTFTRAADGYRVSTGTEDAWALADESRNATLVPGAGVPVVVFSNKNGLGEAARHLDIIDRIDDGIVKRMIAIAFQVHKQRAVIGDLQTTDEDGNPVDYDEILDADPGTIWRLPDGTEVWESSQLNADSVLAPVREDVKQLASESQTPLPTLMSDNTNGSAEGASLSREGITFKVDDRKRRWGPSLVRAARLALAYAGHEVPDELEPMWGPSEHLSLSQRMAAGQSAHAAGVPRAGIFADVLHEDPATVKRWLQEVERERFDRDMAALMGGTDA